MPNIMCFDTATTACTVSLLTDDGQVSRHKEESNIHSTALLRMIDEVLAEASLGLSDIDILGVGIGPGSFTGLRIGIGVAQGLAYTHNIHIAAVSTLEVVALNALKEDKDSEMITVGLDARMGEMYTATFQKVSNSRLSYVSQDRVLSPEKFCEENTFDSARQYEGNAWKAYEAIFNKNGFGRSEAKDMSSGFPNATLFAQYLVTHIEEFTLSKWSELNAQYVRNDVAKKAGNK